MSEMVEVRWHARGGQGAKTASELFADAVFDIGKYVQGFPEYGPERMGAPITAYNRVSDKKIRIHSNIYEPDYVVVLDETLIEGVDCTEGLKESGAIIVNTSKTPDEIRKELGGYKGRVCTIDARTISVDCLGRYFPNTPLLAAAIKITGIMDEETFIKTMESNLKHKFESKPQVIEGNMKAFKRAVSEVKG